MKSMWNKDCKEEIVVRLNNLNSEMKPKWGNFTCQNMLAHLNDSLKMSLGQLSVKQQNLPFRYWPLKQLAVYILPIPKNSPTSPELVSRKGESIQEECKLMIVLLNDFESRKDQNNWIIHPTFGKLSESAWGVLVYRHMNFHLEQFSA